MARRVSVWVAVLVMLLVLPLSISADSDPAPSSISSSPDETTAEQVVDEPLLDHHLWLPVVYRNHCVPSIEITSMPVWAQWPGYLEGRIGLECAKPSDYKVAVYIFVSGWWTKPYWFSPLTSIRSDGTWTCLVTTGGTDELATRFAAFLVPDGYDPPSMSGQKDLPQVLFDNAVAHTTVDRDPIYREIEWSGYTWRVKASESAAGPGPNFFSDREEDVWVDTDGRLHLTISYRRGKWYCTEVFTKLSLGYGRYIFHLASRVDQLDPNVVLGLFTWDDASPEYYCREIDIEFSRWGVPEDPVGQYVVQPYSWPGQRYRFEMPGVSVSTHGFDWEPGSIFFQSLVGYQPFPGPVEAEITSWPFSGGTIPPAGGSTTNARINLWLLGHTPPADGQPIEVIIDSFEFIPVEYL